jgi:hypothetical protein
VAADATEHPLLVNVRPHFEKVYPQSGWSVEYPRPHKKLIPDIVVSGEALGRALEVANALFLAMERRGYQVTLAPTHGYFLRPELDHRDQPRGPLPEYGRTGWHPGRPTVVLVGTVAIGLTVYEVSEYVEVERVKDRYVRKDTLPPRKRRARQSDWVHREDMPSGRLVLRAYSPYSGAPWQQDWREKTPGDLLSQAKAILRELTQAAPIIAASVAEARRLAEIESAAQSARYREYLRAEHARKRAEAQKTSREQLTAAIQHWARVHEITEFLADVERQLEELPADQRSAVADRVALARAIIGNTNALDRFLGWRTPTRSARRNQIEGGDGGWTGRPGEIRRQESLFRRTRRPPCLQRLETSERSAHAIYRGFCKERAVARSLHDAVYAWHLS